MKKRVVKETEKKEEIKEYTRDQEHLNKVKNMYRSSRGPIVVENNLNRFTTYTFNDWKEIIKYEKRENLSNSILVNSLRQGIPFELRPRIWAFLTDLFTLIEEKVKFYS